MPVPKWLWKTANGGRKAPKDYDAWAKYVHGIVDFYNNKLHINANILSGMSPTASGRVRLRNSFSFINIQLLV